MKLKVIAGAKEGVEVPLKKREFIIGRANDCTLRASSDAISRHHCALLKSETGEVTVRDLGSRNGTLVNGVKIDSETTLSDGDELQVGPLCFIAIAAADLNREKKPAVKSVAEAVERAAQAPAAAADNDDISRWLLGPEPESAPASMNETRSFRLDETQAVKVPSEFVEEEKAGDEAAENAGEETLAMPSSEEESDEIADGKKSGFWGGGKKEKRKPGKLPPLPTKPGAKDSREAAADILREMARRR